MGLERTATLDEIKARHRELAKAHWEKGQPKDAAVWAPIQRAFNVLNDSNQRAALDQSLVEDEFLLKLIESRFLGFKTDNSSFSALRLTADWWAETRLELGNSRRKSRLRVWNAFLSRQMEASKKEDKLSVEGALQLARAIRRSAESPVTAQLSGSLAKSALKQAAGGEFFRNAVVELLMRDTSNPSEVAAIKTLIAQSSQISDFPKTVDAIVDFEIPKLLGKGKFMEADHLIESLTERGLYDSDEGQLRAITSLEKLSGLFTGEFPWQARLEEEKSLATERLAKQKEQVFVETPVKKRSGGWVVSGLKRCGAAFARMLRLKGS